MERCTCRVAAWRAAVDRLRGSCWPTEELWPIPTNTATLLDELAALGQAERQEVAEELRKVSETFAEVPDGKTASHLLGVLAHLLDHRTTCTENGRLRDGLQSALRGSVSP